MSFAEAGIALAGSNGSARPRSAAVPGMNWATPCAPAGLTAPGRKALSRQIRRVKKLTGRPSPFAESSTMPHRTASVLSLAGSCGSACARPDVAEASPTRASASAEARRLTLARCLNIGRLYPSRRRARRPARALSSQCGEPINDKIGDLFPAGLDDRHMAAPVERAEFGYRAAMPVARKIGTAKPPLRPSS